MDIKEIREYSEMSRAQFSRVYHIPIRTLENWESGVRKCPQYIIDMLFRIVLEDKTIESLNCYDKNMLKELGYIYRKLLKVINKEGKNPYLSAEAFPTKYFTMLYNTAAGIGIPEELNDRIALFFDRVDPDDWAKSMDIPLPTEKRQYFLMPLYGYEFGECESPRSEETSEAPHSV